MGRQRSDELLSRAEALLPAGVSSPVRAFGAVGGSPLFMARGEGARMTDVDDNTYLDYVCSWGPLILGHAHPDVVRALESAARHGTSFGTPHENEVMLAEIVTRRMPWVEMLRFVNSGTEATMSALRLARAATGRSGIVKFEGHYHGHVDFLLARAGSGVATFSLPDSSGVAEEMTRATLLATWNDLQSVEELFSRHGSEIAALILEPVAGNLGVIPPLPGFLEAVREVTARHDSLLVFDEVITGFRVAPGGAAGLFDIRPDLVCLGKIIGGGLPAGAYGGRRDLMKMVAPLGPVYQAGTLSGNPLAMAAGVATLGQLDAQAYRGLESRGAQLERGLRQELDAAGVEARIHRVGSMMSCFFLDRDVSDSASALSTDREFYSRFFRALLERGVYLPPSALESWFLSTAHTEADVSETVAAMSAVLAEAARKS